jgi:hypothetical protein
MNRIHTIPGCPTVGATECIGIAVKRAAANAAEPVIALTGATDIPCGVVRSVADDGETLDVALPGGNEPVPCRVAADVEELDYLFIDANGKFTTGTTGVRCAQASESGKSGSLVNAYLLPPVTVA